MTDSVKQTLTTAVHQHLAVGPSHNPVKIHLVSWVGPTERPPLILLHGIWDTWRVFAPVLPALVQEQTVYALDFRGHGESDKPATGYTIADYAADVRGVLQQLGQRQVNILGFSLGSLVATQLVAEIPEQLARVILEDPPYNPGADRRGQVAWLNALLELKQLPLAEVVEGLSDLYPTRDQETNERSAQALLNTADGPFLALREDQDIDLPAILGQVRQPLLILRADPQAGGALGEPGRDMLLAARPDAQLVEFPGCGHLIHAEQPAQFLDVVQPFLRG